MAARPRKRTGSRKKTKKGSRNQNFVIDEVAVWLTLAASILLLISNFGFGGFIGESIAFFTGEMFGWGSYLAPFFLFGLVVFMISNKGNLSAYVKTGSGIILFCLICMFLQLIYEVGGVLGALLTGLFIPAFGIAGTYVVVIILAIICVVVITGKSAIKGMRSGSEKVYGRAKQDAAKHKSIREGRLEARRKVTEKMRGSEEAKDQEPKESRRKDRHVAGVSFATSLSAPKSREAMNKSPEIRELTAENGVQEPEDGRIKEYAGEGEPQFAISRAASLEPEDADGAEFLADDSLGPAEPAQCLDSSEESEREKRKKPYQFPPLSLLTKGKKGGGDTDAHLRETARKLEETLHSFGVNVKVTNVSCGPSVTRYELQPEQGVKVSKIVGLSDDIKLNLAAADIRIEAPIPGKALVGIEVPNKENATVMLRDLLSSKEFKASKSKISFAVGRDIAGKTVVADIAKMPHLLVAGATGSGKSVCMNTLVMSILYEAKPEEVRLIMIDPKVVELSVYNGIPHLLIPVVTDPKKAAGALNWAVAEMGRRYQMFAEQNVRDLEGYNEKAAGMKNAENQELLEKMPQIVILVDELADLMMVAPGEVEEAICRLAQLARAAGIHLVLATQRPSVNVITGLIKANMPSRIAFSVSSGVDSRTIIDMNGAEKLLGKGDMLFYPSGYQKPARVQGAFVSDKEVQSVVDYLKSHNEDGSYDEEVVNHVNTSSVGTSSGALPGGSADDGKDTYFIEAGRFIIEKDRASIGMLQRMFKIGFNRAARIMDQLCDAGVVGPEEGTKPRKVLMTMEEFEQYNSER